MMDINGLSFLPSAMPLGIIAAIGVILSAATITVCFYFLAPLVKTEKRKLRLER